MHFTSNRKYAIIHHALTIWNKLFELSNLIYLLFGFKGHDLRIEYVLNAVC